MSVKALFPVASYIEPFAGSLAVLLARSHVRKGTVPRRPRRRHSCGLLCSLGWVHFRNPFGLQFHMRQGMPLFVFATREGTLDAAGPAFWRMAAKNELLPPNRNPAPFEFTNIPFRLPSESPWPRSRFGRGLPGRTMFRFASFPSTEFPASDFLLLPVTLSSPFGLALARAETLRPAPGVVLLRAHSARPAGFGSPANISRLSQTRLDEILPVPPKKHAPSLGSSSHSLSGCPSQTGRKGVTDACISIA